MRLDCPLQFPQDRDVGGVGAMAVRIAFQHREEVSQASPIESGVDLLSEFKRLLTGVSTRHHGGVDIKKVSRLCTREQGDILPATTSLMCRTGPLSIITGGSERQSVCGKFDLCTAGPVLGGG